MTADDLRLVINPDRARVSRGHHLGTFNAPTVNDVAILAVGDPADKCSIQITRKNDGALEFISELHRSYDALQYPLIFWRGDGRYNLNLPQVSPGTTIALDRKKVSCQDYYAYRMMIREDVDNYILKCGRLFRQYIVDMYVKIESERLNFIKHHEKELRSEEYIHLRDIIVGDIDHTIDLARIGERVILVSSFIGGPRNMQEYTQDSMTYVRNCGRPDLFITFTCNPQWEEITDLLSNSRTSRHCCPGFQAKT